MCSISWAWPTDETGVLSILFNRDEQKKRPIALLPRIENINGVKSLMPIDPVGNGTWFAANEQGLVIALLNLYEVELSPQKHLSRGLLVKELSGSKSVSEAVELLKKKTKPGSTSSFAPFSVFIFDREKMSLYFAQWDQQSLVEKRIHKGAENQFFTSSSWNTKAVQEYRTLAYKTQITESDNIVDRRAFHRGFKRDKEEWSVYMSREKTQTVSILELAAGEKSITLNYYDRNSNNSTESSIALL